MGRVFVMLAAPAVFLIIVMLLLAVVPALAAGEAPDPERAERMLPLAILINHVTMFGLLAVFIRREGGRLRDLGWVGPLSRLVILRQAGVALFTGVGWYLIKEYGADSVRAILDGAAPTFTSVFRFRYPSGMEALLVVAISLVFVEESIYRGYALSRLASRYGTTAAVLVSSVFFGLLHAGNGLFALAYTTLAGVFFALVYLRLANGRLWGLTAGHALYNALVLLTG